MLSVVCLRVRSVCMCVSLFDTNVCVWFVIYCVASYVLRCRLFVRVPFFWVCVRFLCASTSCMCVRVCEFACDVVLRLVWCVLLMLMCACVLCTHMCAVNGLFGVRVRLVLLGGCAHAVCYVVAWLVCDVLCDAVWFVCAVRLFVVVLRALCVVLLCVWCCYVWLCLCVAFVWVCVRLFIHMCVRVCS